ncbi:hypothetical protein FC62_GL000236 [Amylolactobacillus amylotrophicus DSM 20534]|uniref:Uncharacterized protein n=3 Tax=Amylolactobacillus TaxID=2767876 RepID=A0A0R1YJV5_9LACO|nr:MULTISPECIES: DegV family protein [Amylolactobacillus]APT19178.1 fatty acid-binding protein DegV [Amylolactobacillus amylophilus DSM 20533 = JCM 1125]KRK38549.1 hypothetical protein FC62_GL000236 [Amylolactobacillus amylotrophicus DSM 20534]KRM42808.1 hypothetical protein FD40_GL000603 [Amylolactobacillus amylophilus DSM 20533 = JCM 1125]GED79671.1 hypothetical protein LAM01_01440 [Amylolactobacillus amylophilus]
MTKIKLVTDSSVQLTPAEIEQYQITIVPLTINIDGQNYVDEVDISRKEFVQKMELAKDLPSTSQPAIGKFVEVFQELIADGSQVLAIMMAESLSGTVNAARQAVQILETDAITVVDCEYTDRAQGQQLIAAAKDIAAGHSMDEVVAHVKQIQENTYLKLVVVNLDNIIKGGRLGKTTGRIATLLNIKAILKMQGGKLEIAQKGRGQKTVNKFKQEVIDTIKKYKNIVEIGLSHVDAEAEMNEFADQIHAVNPTVPILVRETSSVVATHAGRGAFAVIFYTE